MAGFDGIMCIAVDLQLSDTKIIRSRTVYNVVTLISEVSGLADICFVTVTFLLGVFYTPFVLEAALLKHMGPCELPTQYH